MDSGFRLALPVANHVMLVRERLLDRLRGRWFAPVTVVSAPAGYGKTTLLTQAIAANAPAPLGLDCWVACGPDATTASSLGECLLEAVEARPGAARGGEPTDVAAAVGEAIWRRSPWQVCLVIDDVHEIPPDSEAADLLASIVASLPANGHVVLAGRLPPPVPLARLDVQGSVVRIDETDLAFTPAEVAAFAGLRGVPGAKLADCGGWPALAELSASVRTTTAADYIGQEVLSPLGPAERRSLALLAHVGPFDDELAHDVLGDDVDVSDLVAGIPLVTRSPDGERTLHSLWQSRLASETTPTDIADARRRAAATMLRRGRTSTAVRLLIDAQAWFEVADAIVDSLSIARPPVPHDVLADWLGRLPPDMRSSPSGRLLAAVVTSGSDPDEAWKRFEACATRFRSLGHAAGEIACLVHLGELAWWSEQPEHLGSVAMRLFELEYVGWGDAVPLACIARALLYDIQSDSRQVLHELERIDPGTLSDRWQGLVDAFRCTALVQLGRTGDALTTAEEALTHAWSTHAPVIEATKLHALWYEGHITAVLDALPELLERIRAAGYRNQISLAASQGCLASSLQGRLTAAAGHLAEARATATSDHAPMVDTALSVAEAVFAVAEGDEARAAGHLSDCTSRYPLGQGLSAAAQLRSVALIYVLVPESRAFWEEAELGPAFAVGRDLARAVTAVRENRRLPSDTAPLPATGVVRAHLPVPWVAELGIAAVAAGREDGARLLEEAWPDSRPAVAGLAEAAGGPLRKAARATLGRLAVPPTSPLELRLLGPLELLRDGVAMDAPDWRRERVRSLLAYLALHGTVSRERLADDLWPTLDGDGQSRNLRVTLTYLLRVLEPGRGRRDASFFVRQQGNNLSLHAAEWLDVDVWAFDASCFSAEQADRQGSPSRVLEHALAAIALWRGDPVELASEQWAVTLLEQRRLRFATVATRAGELLLARGRTEHARTLAEQALTIDPWLEAAHRLVVASHADDDLAARRALARYREAIRELGLSPDETTLMVERLLDNMPPAAGGG